MMPGATRALPSKGDIIGPERILFALSWEGPQPEGPMTLICLLSESAANLHTHGETWWAVDDNEIGGPVQVVLERVETEGSEDHGKV